MPAALAIQEFDGTSWVGLVPFRMEGVMRRPWPDVPGLSAFAEMNLRVYVERDGKPGVWFISLDAANLPAVWAARVLFHLPYFHARMRVGVEGGTITYASERRRSHARVAFRGVYGPTSATVFEPRRGTIEHFLTERYCLYAHTRDGSIVRTDIHHQPWPLQSAELDAHENIVAEPQGIVLGGSPLLHFSRRQDVVVWNPTRVN